MRVMEHSAPPPVPPATFSSVLSQQAVLIHSWKEFEDYRQSTFSKENARWCFRGVEDASWELKPSLERLNASRSGLDPASLERVFLGRFQRQAHHYLTRPPDSERTLEWFAIMQHWGVPTRLLDFTLSPYIALFFAMTGRRREASHVAIWAIKYTWLQSMASNDLHGKILKDLLPEWSGSSPLQLRDVFDAAFRKREELEFVGPVQPFFMNERLAVQQGIFLCAFSMRLTFEQTLVQPTGFSECVDHDKQRIVLGFAQKLVFPAAARAEFVRHLLSMNITSTSLFPGLEGFAKSFRERYEAIADLSPLERSFALDAIGDVGEVG
jgi:hypothetical protein